MMAKRLNMTNSREVRRAVNRVANMVLNGELEPKAANAILYACNVSLEANREDARTSSRPKLMNLSG